MLLSNNEEYDEDLDEWYETEKPYDEKYKNEYYHGYVYYPLKKNKKGKVIYNEVSFRISKTGFSTDEWDEEVSETKKGRGLTYLGKETFHFKSTDVSKPEYPASSPIKEKFIEMAKETISNLMLSSAGKLISFPGQPPIDHDESEEFGQILEPGKYEVYIANFTEEDNEIHADIKNDEGELFYCTLFTRQIDENGDMISEYFTIKELETKEYVRAEVDRLKAGNHWSNKHFRSRFEKTMQIAVSEFEVVVSE